MKPEFNTVAFDSTRVWILWEIPRRSSSISFTKLDSSLEHNTQDGLWSLNMQRKGSPNTGQHLIPDKVEKLRNHGPIKMVYKKKRNLLWRVMFALNNTSFFISIDDWKPLKSWRIFLNLSLISNYFEYRKNIWIEYYHKYRFKSKSSNP